MHMYYVITNFTLGVVSGKIISVKAAIVTLICDLSARATVISMR